MKKSSQNVTYLKVPEKGGASLSTKEMAHCYANNGFALFYAKYGRIKWWCFSSDFHIQLKSHGVGFPY